MVKIKINDVKHRYDIYHIVSVFYDYSEVEIVDKEYDFYISVENQEVKILKKSGEEYIYKFLNDLKINENIKRGIYFHFEKECKFSAPWGTVIGIRPTKKVIALMEEGYSEEKIIDYFKHVFCTSEEKIRLCIEVAKFEIKIVNKDKKTIGVYIGMPFCPTRCLYCSFTSNPISGCKDSVAPYLAALSKEIDVFSNYINEKALTIESVYFGGGTPTSVDDQQFDYIMSKIFNGLIKDKNIKEFTVECGRPDSITVSKLETMKKFNVSRISINPQSMNNETLKIIGRNHSTEEVIEKFKLSRSYGFDNINMDLIIGLPGEGIKEFNNTYNEILKLAPESITIHGLSIKRGSRLHTDIINNIKFKVTNIEVMKAMYVRLGELAKELKMKPYYMYRQKNMVGNMENVGYSIPGKECIYNVQMIEEKQTVIALGADAVSKVVFLEENRLERFANLKDLKEYITRIDELIIRKKDFLDTLY